ncbi:MAG TPA: response regulator [Stellaceae bacterium]|nr:response regulator [Stellaceae bacterium]
MIQSARLSGPDYRLVFDNAPWPCLVLQPDLVIVAASNAYLDATEMQREAILGRPLLEAFASVADDPSGETLLALRTSLERVLHTRRPDGIAAASQGVRPRSWSLVSSPVLDESGVIAYIVHRIDDTTDMVQLKRAGREHSRMTRRLALRLQAMEHDIDERAQLLDAANERLRATRLGPHEDVMRQLAGAVAHDFNDLMTVIAGSLSVIEDFPGAPSDLLQLAAGMQRAIERGSRLTNQLLAVGRGLAALPDPLALNELLRDFSATAAPPPAMGERSARRRAAASEPVGAPSAARSSANRLVGRCGRILVVEDDPDVLTSVLGAMTRLGYGTVAARDGHEALAALGGSEPLDLLFTDIVMPKGMNGIQLARQARELRPNLPVLLTSGYGFHALSAGADDGFPLLQKPYGRQSLAARLRDLIGS